ncbi:S41 family peptidase [Paenibacillus sp. IB182496]|uniref:S41 family peptidase n=1 Tax=Paenibacillus sabuli TaxID=2772509 RepID=A0A927BSB0_9BACL|nr:S41 family peptidase [Paenibacillus sabuli]MBD2844765.1 S41 family peptidase [Paenibacillus sabuli]
MKFNGRTVVAFILLSVTATVLITLTAADRSVIADLVSRAGLATTPSAMQGSTLTGEEEDKLEAVLSLIENKYYKEVERDDLMDGAINGMIGALEDPYSTYMEGSVAEHFSESIEGSFSGIGAEVTMEGGNITIVSPIKNSPAEKAGLLPKDVLIAVNGESLEGLALNEAVAKIRGPRGTKANVTVRRPGVSEPIELVIVRDDIDVETVYAKMLDGGIGSIEIRQFSMNTGTRFLEELETLEEQGLKGLIIDVRGNPGGVLPVVVSIAEPFVPKGEPIVQVEDRSGNAEQTLSKGAGRDYPLVVLVNGGSASASEVLAGALRERADATIVGETTFGKGTVQVSYNKALGDDSLVKMTIAKWLTPDGNWIHEKGIRPDVEAPPPDYYTAPRLAKDTTLKPDTVGEQVKSMQMMLEGLGYDPGRKDGYYSEQTADAVAKLQADEGLPETGELTPETAEKLESRLVAYIRDDANDTQMDEAVRVLKEQIAGGA